MKLFFSDEQPGQRRALPDFDSPPVIETSVGVQFDGLDRYQSLAAASFWDRVRTTYPRLEEHPPIDPQFETFGPSSPGLVQTRLQFVEGPIKPRFFFVNEGKDELIQLQEDRLFYNWRAVPGGEMYPRYPHLRAMLEANLNTLAEWVKAESLGSISPTQCEVLYVNRIPLRDATGEHCGLSFIFPWLAGLMGTTESGVFQFKRQLVTEGGEPVARLHFDLQYGTGPDGDREARLLLHVRGRPVGPSFRECLEMIDAERAVIVRTFAEITSSEAQEMWGKKA